MWKNSPGWGEIHGFFDRTGSRNLLKPGIWWLSDDYAVLAPDLLKELVEVRDMFRVQIVRESGFSNSQLQELSVVLGISLILIGALVVVFPVLLAITAGSLLVAGGISLLLDGWHTRPRNQQNTFRKESPLFREFRTESDRVYVPREEAARFFSSRF